MFHLSILYSYENDQWICYRYPGTFNLDHSSTTQCGKHSKYSNLVNIEKKFGWN